MLSYQHIYHAGNAADVQKHLWLIATLLHLKQQKQPIFWLDTHAGRGLYDLSSKEAQRLGEYRQGFLKFRDKREHLKHLSEAEQFYLKFVADLNHKKRGVYPGSALIAAKMLTSSDYLELCELHKGEIEHLKKAMAPYKHTQVLKQDGYERLHELAKKNKAGGVLIDPSYEVKSEYEQVFTAVKETLELWSNGTFLIWYPLLPAGHHVEMVKAFQELGSNTHIEECHFRSAKSGERGLYGTGMVIINGPAADFKDMLEKTLKFK